MQTAKEYFFEKINHKRIGYYDNISKRIYELHSRNMHYSNAWEFEILLERLIKENKKNIIGDLIEKTFVGKLKNYSTAINSLTKSESLTNPLIVYNVGFTMAALFISECFLCYLENNRFEDEFFFSEINRFFSRWRSQNNYIRYADTFAFNEKYGLKPSEQSLGITTLIESYVICHEIAHHLNGDTRHELILYTGKQFFTPIMQIQNESTQIPEVEADFLAWVLMLGGPDVIFKSSGTEKLIQATWGSLLSATIAALLVEKPNEQSLKYPSAKRRFDNLHTLVSLERKSLGDSLSRELYTGKTPIESDFKEINAYSNEELGSKISMNSMVKNLGKDIQDFHDLCYYYR